jgi:PST family polysaccharide transporter
LIRKVLRLQGGFALMLSLALLAFAPWIIRLAYGPAYEDSIKVLRWLALLPFMVGLSNVLGIHTMLTLGMKRTFSGILIAAGALNLFVLFVLARRFGAVGAAMAVLTTEVFVTLLMAAILRRRGVPIFKAEASA